MADLGILLGSFMTGLIKARREADEQTAALAEYYKDNPLLEGLSVPRVRIPELTLDIPMLIEDYVGGERGEIKEPRVIANQAKVILENILTKYDMKMTQDFYKVFISEVASQLERLKNKEVPVMKESVARTVQEAFTKTVVRKKKTELISRNKEAIVRELKSEISKDCMEKIQEAPSIVANIRTADVKERASSGNVVHLKITLKEEGLEWTTHMNETGGVISNLQPE